MSETTSRRQPSADLQGFLAAALGFAVATTLVRLLALAWGWL